MSANDIVVVNVSQTQAPLPNNLQKMGAMVSQGATTNTPGVYSLLTQPSDLTSLLRGSAAISAATYSSGTVTVTTSTAHGLPIGDPILLTIAGCTPAGYNGTYLCTPTDTTHFTYAVTGSLGSLTTAGVWTPEDVAELIAMVDTFFAQGNTQSVYVLELGPDSVTAGVNFLSAWITANPGVFYSYLVPRAWDANATFLALLALFESTTAKTYFHITTTLATYGSYTSLMKCVIATIESPPMGTWAGNALTSTSLASGIVTFTTTSAHGVAVGQWYQITGSTPAAYNGWYLALPGTTGSTLVSALAATPGAISVEGSLVASYYSNPAIPATEFSAAAGFFVSLNYAPSNINKVTPFCFSFLVGVTAFPVNGTSALRVLLKTAGVNIIGTGAEGGLTNTLLLWGTTMDGRDFTYWYSVDWAQIQLNLNLSNEIINGSNNPLNPLYYNQDGINRLQKRAQGVMNNGVTFGLVLAPVTVAAVPFNTYVSANPSDFRIGKYAGLSVIYTPNRGFSQIEFLANVTDFAAA